MKTTHLLGLKSGRRSGSKIINLQAVKYSKLGHCCHCAGGEGLHGSEPSTGDHLHPA